MTRFAFKRLLDGSMEKGPLEKYLAAETGLSIRHAKDAVEDARQTIQSQHELVKEHLALWRSRLHQAEKKREKLQNKKDVSKRKLDAATAKVEKRKRKVVFWETHLQNKTFPPVVFGGKSLFHQRCKGNMTKEQWQEVRNHRICSRGDATKKGNPNLRVLYTDGRFSLQISIDQKEGKQYSKITLPLYVPRKISKKTGQLNGRDYHGMMANFLQTGKPYQVEILHKNGLYYAHITIEEPEGEIVTHPKCGIYGTDTNPDGLGYAHVTPTGNPRKFGWRGNGELTYARTNRRNHLIGELAKGYVLEARSEGAVIAVEDLKFIRDKEVSAKMNRISHSFMYRRLLQAIERNCKRYGVELIKVHPAFTSVIGRLKYQPQYHINVHQSAALVIGRRALGTHTEKVPRALIKLCISKKKQVGFRQMSNWKQWSAIKKSLTKKIKLKGGTLVSWLDYRKELLSTI